jgi:hypothetical protein
MFLAQVAEHHHSFYETYKVAIWLVGYYTLSAFVSSLPAPTAKSSQVYLFFFKFCNTLGANLIRAYSTQIEKSPNWQAAVEKTQQNQP